MTGHDIVLPTRISLPEGKTLLCKQAVRVLPGKRTVCTAELDAEPVYAKLFTDAARRQWEKELQAYNKAAGLAVPEVLYSAALDDPKCFVIVTRAIDNSASLLDCLQQNNNQADVSLLALLIKQYAGLHAAGAVHTDPHLGNFLLQADKLYLLDVSAFDFRSQPLDINTVLDNLALLLAQFPVAGDDFYLHALKLYQQQRDAASINSDDLLARIRHYLQRRNDNLLKKIWRSSSRYVAQQNFFRRSIVRRTLQSDNMASFIDDPDSVMQQADAVMLKDGNSSTVKQVTIDGRKLIVKRYNIKSPWHALKRAIQPTRAARSWKNSNLLLHVGINTPLPVAMVEKRLGPFRGKAWFVYEYVEGQTARDYFSGHTANADDMAARQVCWIVRQMQKFNIAHGDLKATNFLVSGDKVYLLDLDSMRQIKSESAFNKAHKVDIMRLLVNWDTESGWYQLIKQMLAQNTWNM